MSRKMKASQVEWIGDIPDTWSIGRVKNGFYRKKEEAHQEDPVILSLARTGVRVRDISNNEGQIAESYYNYNVVSVGDLLLNPMDLYSGANCSISRVEGVISPAYINLGAKDGFSPCYYDYYFKTQYWAMAFFAHGKGVSFDNRWTLGAEDLMRYYIPIPPIEEQKSIATYLDNKCAQINSVIEQTQHSIEEYKRMRQAVISQAVTRGIRPNRTMKDSGMEWVKQIPDDWSPIPSKYLFINSDTRRQPNDVMLTASQKYGIISQEEYMERENAKIVLANKGLEDWKHVEPYDFIISLRSFQGGLEMSETTGCITWHYIVLKPCKEIHSRYYKWLFKSDLYIKALQGTCNFIRDGQDLRYSNFVQVPLFEPSISEQIEIADYLDVMITNIDELISKKEQFISELEKYRRAIIYDYVTGKREVPV